MALPFGLIVFLVGIAYGWLSPGKENKGHIFKMGLVWGLVVAIVVALLGFFFHVNPLGLGDSSFLGLLVSFVVMTVVFIVGVWIGDLLPGGKRGVNTTRGIRRV